jgi:hypothetical protein
VEWGNSVHLLQGRAGIASVHDTGLENDLCVNPAFERARELFLDLGVALFGLIPIGTVEWLVVRKGMRE